VAEPRGASTQDWMLEQVLDDGPPLVLVDDVAEDDIGAGDDLDDELSEADAKVDSDATGPRRVSVASGVHDLDTPSASVSGDEADVNAGAKRTLWWLASGVALVAVLIVLAFLVFGGGPAPVESPQNRAAPTPAVAPVPQPPELPVPPQDQAIPFEPRTDSCPGGPTSPLALTDTTSDSAWVCSRGPQESQLDGQILHVKFLCNRSRSESTCSYMLNSLSVTPGWVAKTPGGKDEWLQHRVVRRLQFNFYNGDQLAADPFFLDTNSVHGPVPATLPGKILASRVDVMILHTERPPAAPRDGAPPGPDGGVVGSAPQVADSMLGGGDPFDLPPVSAPGTAAQSSDPVDATFAMSQLQFFGHPPS